MPPKYAVRLLPAAEADFREIIAYIVLDNPSAAAALAGLIEKRITSLSIYPFRGKIPDEENLSRIGYRYLVANNFLIFYTIDQRTVWIHRIIHGARDYLSLF